MYCLQGYSVISFVSDSLAISEWCKPRHHTGLECANEILLSSLLGKNVSADQPILFSHNLWPIASRPHFEGHNTFNSIPKSSALRLDCSKKWSKLKPQAEKIIAEEQAGFRAGRSTTEQILDLWVLCEKYLQHQQDIYHFFIDFKKAFDSVWHTALWAIMKKYNISTNLIRVIKNLYQCMIRPLVQSSSTAA